MKTRLGITIGDSNGIGIEIILKTFKDNRMLDFCTPVIFGSNEILSQHKKILQIHNVNFNVVRDLKNLKPNKINLLEALKNKADVKIGEKNIDGGDNAINSIDCAIDAYKKNKIDALVTAPINKSSIQKNKSDFIGHTEYLQNNFNGNSLMIMVSEVMKIACLTGHTSLSNVKNYISKENIIENLLILNNSLKKDFGKVKPKIAVLGLNPHAGESGMLGNEEIEIIIPAIDDTKDTGLLVFGPYSADSFFTTKNLSAFDGILAMYHDQGLIPFKTLAFDSGVNFTAGLDIIRTSPVHGTAFEIAGKGLANENSFRQAVFLACEIYKQRKLFIET
ncbi:MAG: 4-hydroxythreonine-4-phosphate dehydrogenase PdxA [Flavobacteriales bacterium]|nr:4-hydroxythreonine-4-phosphate dehydrogenase PdxA [Flavobacteriales bacterium]